MLLNLGLNYANLFGNLLQILYLLLLLLVLHVLLHASNNLVGCFYWSVDEDASLLLRCALRLSAVSCACSLLEQISLPGLAGLAEFAELTSD